MSNDLGEKFDMLVEMDSRLDTRKGKAPEVPVLLQKSRVPFIFMNAAGLQGDLDDDTRGRSCFSLNIL